MPSPAELGSREIVGIFFEEFERAERKSWVGKIAMPSPSDQASETYKWLGSTAAMREWVGGRIAKHLRTNGLTIANKTWESTLPISTDDLRRDKTTQIRGRIGELAQSALAHKAKLLTEFITAGTAATKGTAYDGQFFFDDDHVEGNSGTQKNLLTATEVGSLNIADADVPTESEASLALLNVIGYMLAYKDDQGEPRNELAREFLVMLPYNLWGAFLAAVSKANLTGASGAVSANPLLAAGEQDGFKVTAVMNARLTVDTEFYMFRTDNHAKPFIDQEEEGTTLSAVAEGSEHEFWNREHVYGVTRIGNIGYGMWWQAAHCTFS